MPAVCDTAVVHHYFLHGDPDAGRLARDGLSPRPASDADMAVHREVYAALFAPALGRPFPGPGVFFTPVDFHALPGMSLATRPRVSLAVGSLDPSVSALTWELGGERVHERADEAGLRRAAAVWTEPRIREWFGRDRTRLFWHLPQIGCFAGVPIAVGTPRWPGAAPGGGGDGISAPASLGG